MAVTILEITRRWPAGGGRSFGNAGSYEQIEGTAHFAVDPQHPDNQRITDIGLAPRGADGLVHFSATFFILKPADPTLGNRRLFLGVPNRGNRLTLVRFNFAPAGPEPEEGPDLGDGFLMRHGYTVVECGWEWGARGEMSIAVPEADSAEGPLSGKVMLEWQPDQPRTHLHFSEGLRVGSQPYPAMDINDPEASLAVREHQTAPRQLIDRSVWQFAKVENGEAVPDPQHVFLSKGFEAGKIYELVYRTARAPIIGLGMLAIRDIVSFLKYTPEGRENPCAGSLDCAYAWGPSQCGRLLRQLLYVGLNQDEAERLVFDGVLTQTAGHRWGPFNQRFGVPSNLTEQGAANLFPFADAEQTDPVTGRTDGLLSRLAQLGKVPKVFYINSSCEYWRGGAFLIHSDVQGTRDVSPPDSTRIYHMAGAPHSHGTLPLTGVTALGERTRYALNSVDYRPLLRAALLNLDRWVTEGVAPPPSQHPQIANGTAVPPESLEPSFAAIPGVTFPKHVPRLPRLDFGPEWLRGVATTLPPKVGQLYASLVSAVDEDGNEVAGIRLPDVAVPLASYTGWNQRHPDIGGEDEVMLLQGATFPFPRDAAERRSTGDPRRSIEERYGSKDEYLERFRQAAEELVAARYVLAEDVERMMEGASRRWDLFVGATSA